MTFRITWETNIINSVTCNKIKFKFKMALERGIVVICGWAAETSSHTLVVWTLNVARKHVCKNIVYVTGRITG